MSSDILSNIMNAGSDDAPQRPVALTIAGSDSGGGAGIQADLKTFAACEVHGTSVVTLVTAQNTRGVSDIHVLPPETLRAQYQAVVSDLEPAAAKTGALGSAETIEHVAELMDDRPIPRLVIDPVMISKHGDPLLPEDAHERMKRRLIPHAGLVTPNRHEAEILSGRSVGNIDSMKDAAKRIFDLGPSNVLIKGGHLDNIVRDILYDGSGFVEFGADKLKTERLHGSGCVFSSAITGKLADGADLLDAVGFARDFITEAIRSAPRVGEGISPVNPMHPFWNQQ